ncbi:hypothetical protein DSECCO2_469380 [anaerobic digester metagenome]
MENKENGLVQSLPKVTADRKYWMVRSMGGDYYGEFTQRGFIGIGYNEILLDEIKLASSYNEKANEQLRLIIESKEIKTLDDDEPYNSTYAAAQMLKFYSDIKIGDIIVIPGKSSLKLTIAEVTSNAYEEQRISPVTGYCQFKKRRKIKVLKETTRPSLNPEMQLMFNSRHIISNVDKYAEFIDSTVYDFYQKDGTTFLVLRVKQENEINAVDFNLIPEIIKTIEDFSIDFKFKFNRDDVKMKICVQSPGDMLVFAQQHWEVIMLIGATITWLKGLEIEIGKFVKFKVPSVFENVTHLINAYNLYLDKKADRHFKDIMRKKLENMDIDTPSSFTKVMSEFNKGREKY